MTLLEQKAIEFYAILLLCADHHIMLECYSDIDDIINTEDFVSLLEEYYLLAEEIITFNEVCSYDV